ncbi:hypothetical protein niasHT_012180 [Heterodera trifolii]|uniref:Uncharacterized protein n=1 Tax=Heterodera trifolii TaxID=157864 RepID=A0ABD2KU16_9BILA
MLKLMKMSEEYKDKPDKPDALPIDFDVPTEEVVEASTSNVQVAKVVEEIPKFLPPPHIMQWDVQRDLEMVRAADFYNIERLIHKDHIDNVKFARHSASKNRTRPEHPEWERVEKENEWEESDEEREARHAKERKEEEEREKIEKKRQEEAEAERPRQEQLQQPNQVQEHQQGQQHGEGQGGDDEGAWCLYTYIDRKFSPNISTMFRLVVGKALRASWRICSFACLIYTKSRC